MINRTLWLALFGRGGRGGSVIRYFRRNEGTTDYATIPEVVLSGDFVIEFDFLASEVSGHFLSNSSKTSRFGFERATNRVFIQTDNGLTRFEHNVELQLYSKLMLSRVSGVLSCVLNGEQLNLQDDSPTGLTNTGAFYLNQIYNKWVNPTSVEIFKGILANLKIYDNGTLVRDYPLNDNSNILANRAAELGGDQVINPPSDLGVGWIDNGDGSYTCDGSQSVGALLRFTNAQFNIGDSVLTRLEIVSITSGDIRVSIQGSTESGPSLSSTGNYSHVSDITENTSTYGLLAGSTFIGTVRAISIRQADGYGTIINGNADDWGLFDRQASGDWKGNGLIVPPWDSVDQVLVTA